MGRRIKHIHAKPNEWVRVHRGRGPSGGGGGGGNGAGFFWIIVGIGLTLLWLYNDVGPFITENWVAISAAIVVALVGCAAVAVLWFCITIWKARDSTDPKPAVTPESAGSETFSPTARPFAGPRGTLRSGTEELQATGTEKSQVSGTEESQDQKRISMLRDIDYAAKAVKTAIVEKFGRVNALENLRVVAKEKTIAVCHDQRVAEGTRDNLLAAVRKADSYDKLWQVLPSAHV